MIAKRSSATVSLTGCLRAPISGVDALRLDNGISDGSLTLEPYFSTMKWIIPGTIALLLCSSAAAAQTKEQERERELETYRASQQQQSRTFDSLMNEKRIRDSIQLEARVQAGRETMNRAASSGDLQRKAAEFQKRNAIEEVGRPRRWSVVTKQKLYEGIAWIGMTSLQARLAWGDPDHVNTTITKGSKREQWVYGKNQYLYVHNGVITSIQQSR